MSSRNSTFAKKLFLVLSIILFLVAVILGMKLLMEN